MVLIRKGAVSIGEVWFDEELENPPKVDVLYYIERTEPLQDAAFDEFYTILIDLTQPQGQLWEQLGKNNRYKINRATQKDQVQYQSWYQDIPSSILSQFADCYNAIAPAQGLSLLKLSQLRQYIQAGVLDISQTALNTGEPLVWHVHYRSSHRVRLLHSASNRSDKGNDQQSLIGRANRYHHWQDILRFKEAGITAYDFGGWYAGNTDQKKLGINRFKEEFGGNIIKNFNGSYGLTLKGKMYLNLKSIIKSSQIK
jgi:hypothetical protein